MDAWRRSIHSTQMIGVMPGTRGRGTGESGKTIRIPGEPCALKGACTVRRGVIGSTGYLLYLVGRWFDPSWAHFIIRNLAPTACSSLACSSMVPAEDVPW